MKKKKRRKENARGGERGGARKFGGVDEWIPLYIAEMTRASLTGRGEGKGNSEEKEMGYGT